MTNSSHKVDQVATISAKRKTQSEQKVTSWKTTSITPVCLLTYILCFTYMLYFDDAIIPLMAQTENK